MPTFHVYWADKRPRENQKHVADAVSRAMANISEAMITGPADVTMWFHRFPLADIYVNGASLNPTKQTIDDETRDTPPTGETTK